MSGFGEGDFGACVFGDGSGGDTIRNLGFEEGTFGFAASWEVDGSTVAGTFAEFGVGAVEDFEHAWDNGGYDFDLEEAIAAAFSADVYVTPPNMDDFERGWTNFPYSLTSFTGIAAVFDGEQVEDFEEDWDANEDNLYVFDLGDLTAAVFGMDDFEAFEEGWGNDDYDLTWPGGTDAAFSGQLAASVEDFESVLLPKQFTIDNMLNTIETLAHGLGVDYRVIFAVPIAGSMPLPLAPLVPYYVQAVPDADSFKVALVAGAGAAIDITSNGEGLLMWSAPYEFWTTDLGL